VVVSRISSYFKPLISMTAGVVLAACAMFLAGSSLNPWLLMLSIVVLAFGEMSASPKFLEYVGSIAPPDKVALFLGYGFLPIGIGNALGNLLGGIVYGALDAGKIHISMVWYIYGCIGILTALLLILYNRFLAPALALGKAGEPVS
jgi:dipeptide/tripeptide permease